MKKKFLKISIVVMMFVLAYSTIVNALSFTATMTPSSTTVAESTEFTVSIKVSNLDVGSNGINSLSGYLDYDETVFETISDSSIDGLNSWSPTYTADSGRLTLTKPTFVKAEESVFQITFKTKSGVSGKSGQISFSTIVASNSQDDISASDISTSITVGTGSGNATNNVSNNPVNNTLVIVPITNTSNNAGNNTNTARNTANTTRNTSNTTRNNLNNAVSSYVNTSNSISEENIPYTGVEDTVMYVMVVILAMAIIFYIKFEKINKEMK